MYNLLFKENEEKEKALNVTLEETNERYKNILSIYKSLEKELSLLEQKSDMIDYGLYNPIYNFETSQEYKGLISSIASDKNRMAKDKIAVLSSIDWSVNGSVRAGRAKTNEDIKILLKCFNSDFDSMLSKLRWNNIDVIQKRFESNFNRINKIEERNGLKISLEYYELLKTELMLEYEYILKTHEEKELYKSLREEQREEEKALREIQREREKAEKEEVYYTKALKKVQLDIEGVTGFKYEELTNKIQYLEAELKQAKENKERALSMAQQTRRGYVYVISNIGSFGENVYKIGMTRRLDPID